MTANRPLIRRLRSTLFMGLLALTPLSVQAETARERWHADIGQGYLALQESSSRLADAASAYCETPSGPVRERVEALWREAFLNWQRIRFVNFGPIEQNSRAWQFQFWPDPRNLVANKVRYWLNSDSPLTAQTLASAGVAVQGFPALEYLLTDSTFTQSGQSLPSTRTCELLTAITTYVNGNARQVASDWQALKPHYLATEDYTHTTIRAALSTLEVLRDRRLGGPMGLRGNGKRNPYQADAWRSRTSLATLAATIEGLESLFVPGLKLKLEAAEQPQLGSPLDERMAAIQADFDTLPDAMAPLLEDNSRFRELQALYIDLVQLEQIMNEEIASALGVVQGFNASDGD